MMGNIYKYHCGNTVFCHHQILLIAFVRSENLFEVLMRTEHTEWQMTCPKKYPNTGRASQRSSIVH